MSSIWTVDFSSVEEIIRVLLKWDNPTFLLTKKRTTSLFCISRAIKFNFLSGKIKDDSTLAVELSSI